MGGGGGGFIIMSVQSYGAVKQWRFLGSPWSCERMSGFLPGRTLTIKVRAANVRFSAGVPEVHFGFEQVKPPWLMAVGAAALLASGKTVSGSRTFGRTNLQLPKTHQDTTAQVPPPPTSPLPMCFPPPQSTHSSLSSAVRMAVTINGGGRSEANCKVWLKSGLVRFDSSCCFSSEAPSPVCDPQTSMLDRSLCVMRGGIWHVEMANREIPPPAWREQSWSARIA